MQIDVKLQKNINGDLVVEEINVSAGVDSTEDVIKTVEELKMLKEKCACCGK